jgi:uncharacterized protein with HEPN domain
MPKDDQVYLGHMLDTARKIQRKIQYIDRAQYDSDENLRLALVHLVQVLGEAARRVSPEQQAAAPSIPWREVTGMRHKIVHDYLDVDEDIVWAVVTHDIPPLITILETLISDTGGAPL